MKEAGATVSKPETNLPLPPVAKVAPQPAVVPGREPSAEQILKVVLSDIESIVGGPRVLRLYMENCARCGTCAEQCPVYQGRPEKRYNPVLRSDLIRAVYKRRTTASGRLFGRLAGARDFTPELIKRWAEDFYACTGCRRCANFCPLGIDNSVITRKGRAILNKLGLTPERLLLVIQKSHELGNTDGATPKAFLGAIDFLKEEMKEEHGVDIPIPVDVEGAEYFYVPPSGDVLVNPEATTGIAKIFYVLGLKDKWTMSSHFFDGANYGLFTGDDESMKAVNNAYVEEAKRLKAKVLFMGECGHAYRVMKHMMEPAKWWGELPFRIINCMEFTTRMIEAGKLHFDRSANAAPVTYHDPCNFGRSCNIVEEPRMILQATCQDFREMYPNRQYNWCCGGGAGLSAMDDIYEFRMTISGRKKLEQVRATGAKYLAAACSNCKRQLTQLMEYHKMDVKVGGVHDMVSRSILIDGKPAQRIDYEH